MKLFYKIGVIFIARSFDCAGQDSKESQDKNKIHLDWRFIASAIFSALMAIYYALSETFFN